MNSTQIFPFAVGLLEFAAAAVYLYNKQFHLAVAWFCYSIAAVALGLVKP